jgi:hypothetical protein
MSEDGQAAPRAIFKRIRRRPARPDARLKAEALACPAVARVEQRLASASAIS